MRLNHKQNHVNDGGDITADSLSSALARRIWNENLASTVVCMERYRYQVVYGLVLMCSCLSLHLTLCVLLYMDVVIQHQHQP